MWWETGLFASFQSISPQDAHYKGKTGNFTVEKRGRHHPDQEIKINITGNKKTYQNHVPLDRMDWGEHVTPVVYLLKTHNPNLIMSKHQRTQLKDSVQNNWQICFKSVKVIKDKNWGTIIEWRRWNATEDPGLDPEPEKEQQKNPKTPGKIQIRSAD